MDEEKKGGTVIKLRLIIEELNSLFFIIIIFPIKIKLLFFQIIYLSFSLFDKFKNIKYKIIYIAEF